MAGLQLSGCCVASCCTTHPPDRARPQSLGLREELSVTGKGTSPAKVLRRHARLRQLASMRLRDSVDLVPRTGSRIVLWLMLALIPFGCVHGARRSARALPPPGSPAPLELRRRYSGTYVFAGGDSERAAVAASVDRAVAQMSVFAIEIARGALLARAEIRASYAISFDDVGNIKVESPGEFPEVSPSDGTPVQVVNRFGDESELGQQFIDGALVQSGRADDGGGTTTFELQPDGETLIVRRVMESSQLPRPVEYALTYRRELARGPK